MASRVTSDGQVTIPQSVRDRLGLSPGSEVEFRETADGSIVLEKAPAPHKASRFAYLVGSAGPGLTTDEIMALTRGE